jgi:single-strand DNA-binding protein
MKDLNRVLLMGRLGNQPTRRETKNGNPVVHFSLATSRKIVDQTEGAAEKEREETQWHKVVVWGKQAEACNQYLRKGETVFIEGMMRSRKYTDKKGESRLAFEVPAESVTFIGGKRRADGPSPADAPLAAPTLEAPVEMAMSA